MKEYIVFLLGTDNFNISWKVQATGKDWGMFQAYESCCYIADKFLQYDKRNEDIMSEYESLCNFLEEYEDEIYEFLDNGTNFEIKGEEL